MNIFMLFAFCVMTLFGAAQAGEGGEACRRHNAKINRAIVHAIKKNEFAPLKKRLAELIYFQDVNGIDCGIVEKKIHQLLEDLLRLLPSNIDIGKERKKLRKEKTLDRKVDRALTKNSKVKNLVQVILDLYGSAQENDVGFLGENTQKQNLLLLLFEKNAPWFIEPWHTTVELDSYQKASSRGKKQAFIPEAELRFPVRQKASSRGKRQAFIPEAELRFPVRQKASSRGKRQAFIPEAELRFPVRQKASSKGKRHTPHFRHSSDDPKEVEVHKDFLGRKPKQKDRPCRQHQARDPRERFQDAFNEAVMRGVGEAIHRGEERIREQARRRK